MIYFISDLHLQHNKEFIFTPRGFNTVEDMNETLIKNINDTVGEQDQLYILGDLVLGGNVDPSIIKRINCQHIYMIIGNHDTDNRLEYYKTLSNITILGYASMLRFDGYRFYLSHYITLCTPITEAKLKSKVINLFGHTHQKKKFYMDNPWSYCVCADANDNKPVSITEIINNCKTQWENCKKEL